MKILLINPTMEHDIGGNLPNYVSESRGSIPPLGLLYVAAALQDSHEVKVVDMMAGEGLIKCDFKPDLIGITTTTFTLLDVLEIAETCKTLWKDTPIMLGGIHPTIYPSETLSLPNVDFVFAGEADGWTPRTVGSIKGITFGELVDVTKLPYPARKLADTKLYSSVLGKNGHIATMFTSRGCPYGCVFCHRETMGRKYRARTAEQVVAEIKDIKAMGIDEILIYDDTFTVDKQRVWDICKLINDEGIKVAFDIRARVDTVDIYTLAMLKDAGCKRIHYGVEASSDKLLKALGKGITIDQVNDAFAKTRLSGIETLAYFIIGSPTETQKDIDNTIAYSKYLRPDYCHYAIMTPYPATPLYEQGLKEGLYRDYWQEYAEKPSDGFLAPHWPELGEEVLQKLIHRAYKSFYYRPSKIWDELVKSSPRQIAKKAVGAVRLIRGR